MKHLSLQFTEESAAEVLPLASRYGWGLELTSFFYPSLIDHPVELVESHREWLGGFAGLRSIHGAFYDLSPGATDRLIREATLMRIRQGIGFAHEMNASHVSFHNSHPGHSRFDSGWVERSA